MDRLDRIIKESIGSMNRQFLNEKKKKKKERAGYTGPNYNETGKKKNDDKQRKKAVISYFKQAGVKCAPYAYKLWPKLEQSNARSQFTKCLKGRKNDNGVPYTFTQGEINRLYSMITSTETLAESKRQRIRKIVTETIKEELQR